MRRLLVLPAGLLLLAGCSGGAQEAVSPSPTAPTQTTTSAAPAPSSASPSAEPSEILAVLCDSATDEQLAVLEAAMKPGYKLTKVIDVRTREGGEHALLGIVKGPEASGPARWIGSKMTLEDLQSADAAAAAASTAPLMTAPSEKAIDYLNQTQTCFDAIYE